VAQNLSITGDISVFLKGGRPFFICLAVAKHSDAATEPAMHWIIRYAGAPSEIRPAHGRSFFSAPLDR
jgi:hypothetical protein